MPHAPCDDGDANDDLEENMNEAKGAADDEKKEKTGVHGEEAVCTRGTPNKVEYRTLGHVTQCQNLEGKLLRVSEASEAPEEDTENEEVLDEGAEVLVAQSPPPSNPKSKNPGGKIQTEMTSFFRKQPAPKTPSRKREFLTPSLTPQLPTPTPKSKNISLRGGKSKIGNRKVSKAGKKQPAQKTKITEMFKLKITTKPDPPVVIAPSGLTGLSLTTDSPENPALHNPEEGADPVLASHSQGEYHSFPNHLSRTNPTESATIFTCSLCMGNNVPVITACSCRAHFQLFSGTDPVVSSSQES